ncbi:MAG TPA: DUF359 domain-containing protein [Aigarchaeota archaeon]|nr:DUF359 domain-containing protein [Aigarchaeota archaeon]
MRRWPYGRRLCFSEDLKEELRKPLGVLYVGDVTSSSRQAVEAILARGAEPVVTVGDVTTSSFIKQDLKPKTAIVDYRFERVDFRERVDFSGYRVVRIRNPAGCISPEAAEAVFSAVQDEGSVVLVVEGEEDLLALPAILACGDGGAVAYGQPKTGCVVVFVDGAARGRVVDILRRAGFT